MRLFIATSFPVAIMRDLNARVGAVRPKLAQASWVRPETQHLTFAFLGEQEEALVDTIEPALKERLANLPRFEARLRGCGFFPNARRPRVGWIGLSPEQPFIEIANAVREVVTQAGVELDRAAFKPHLTLMRIRDSWPHGCIETFERALGTLESEPFTVDTVTLYSSKLSPQGAVHTGLAHYALSPHPGKGTAKRG